jgi:DNA invertase Pin-like site-specific DNA recombinase
MQPDAMIRLVATTDVAGPILVTVLGMVAELERSFIRERRKASTLQRSDAGVQVNAAPRAIQLLEVVRNSDVTRKRTKQFGNRRAAAKIGDRVGLVVWKVDASQGHER